MPSPVINKRYPFTPFPTGWFFVDISKNLPKGKLLGKRWMGKKIVAWRTGDDEVCVADATCPHLGACLAPEWGGRLVDNELVCPFHGFRYGSDGVCVGSPSGPLKRKLELNRYPVEEIHGVILAYWHPEGKEPTWRIPVLDQEDWTPLIHETSVIKTHPQETSENGVDVAHLALVHNYQKVSGGRSLLVDGALLQNRFNLSRQLGPSPRIGFTIDVQAVVSIWGLGYSLIELKVPDAGSEFRLLALCTPIDGEKVEFVMAMQSKYIERPNAFLPGLSLVPRSWLRAIGLRVFFNVYTNDISQDFDIWENKEYLTHPGVNHTDGAIMQFRKYCRQFYTDSDAYASLMLNESAQNGELDTASNTVSSTHTG